MLQSSVLSNTEVSMLVLRTWSVAHMIRETNFKFYLMLICILIYKINLHFTVKYLHVPGRREESYEVAK
jgi:hypothetical protein